jgi:hypothetical protein
MNMVNLTPKGESSMKNLLLICMLMVMSFAANAQKANLGKTLKEIILKGSIDGDNVTMVYGLGEAWEDIKDLSGGSLKKEDFVDLGSLVYNKEHDDDYVDMVQDGYAFSKESGKFAKENVKEIVTKPFKSLKKIPKSYQINFDNAREAYYDSNNALAGVVKYTGWAVWAQIEGAYYLVVEAPVVLVSEMVQTSAGVAGFVLGVPGAILIQSARVVGKVIGISLKFVFRNAASLVAGAYSVLSTSVASTITLAAAGGIAIYKGTKLLVTAPARLAKVASVKKLTEFAYDKQKAVALRMQMNLGALPRTFSVAKEKIENYSSKFVVKFNNVKAMIINIKIEAKKVVISASATAKYLKELKELNPNMSKEELVEMITGELNQLTTIAAQ